ncbi:MAG: GNAT family N-acetyltransferase [Ruminococcaceae bacterium]|nr:GNAT family N-acetyltransferase [Oscillospiraceae bacterium]
MIVRYYRADDVPVMRVIWNQVVEDGIAFPQLDCLTEEEAEAFFAEQTCCAVAEQDGKVVGLYILHPNNIGRCGHIGNASYAVERSCRGMGAGEALVSHCLTAAKEKGFRLIQFNAVVKTNAPARHIYEKLGFVTLGTIPGGFRMDDRYEDIVLYYYEL